MNAEGKGKRIFITAIMVLMLILTVGTMIFADESGGVLIVLQFRR